MKLILCLLIFDILSRSFGYNVKKKNEGTKKRKIYLIETEDNTDGGKSCKGPGGKVYKDGENFPCEDGCNTCGCKDGLIISTLIVREPLCFCKAPQDPVCGLDGKDYCNPCSADVGNPSVAC